MDRCQSHRSEACCVSDYSGRTALHLASFNNGSPNFVVNALMEANPHAVVKQDSYGQTPLHYACQFSGGTNDLVLLYCETLTELSQARMDVRNACPMVTASPLYLACARNASISVLKALVDTQQLIGVCWIAPVTGGELFWNENETIIHVEDGSTKTPLSVLVEACPDVNTCMTIESDALLQEMKSVAIDIMSGNGVKVSDSLANSQDPVLVLWSKSLVLIQQQYHSCTNDNNPGASLLHFMAALKVPVPLLFAWCAQVFSSPGAQRDSRGHVALHYALQNPSLQSSILVSILLHYQPASARISFPNGASTLVVALQEGRFGWDTILQPLALANPDTLSQRHEDFYPYQLAASLEAHTDTIYGLLRLRPDLVAA